MDRQVIALLFLVAFGLIFGTLAARSSNRRETIHGGLMAQIFNFIAAALMVSVLPTVLVNVFIMHLPFIQIIGIALGMSALALLMLMVYAVFEKPSLDQIKDEGWTEEDARTSGL